MEENFYASFGKITIFILSVIGIAAISWAAQTAFDSTMDNRDRMLCNSAKVSGNEIYLKKCSCFYAGEDIRCIAGEK